jgi:hypothetical protein
VCILVQQTIHGTEATAAKVHSALDYFSKQDFVVEIPHGKGKNSPIKCFLIKCNNFVSKAIASEEEKILI